MCYLCLYLGFAVYLCKKNMRKGFLALLGFALLAIGLLSLILGLLGLQFSFLLWMDRLLGLYVALLVRLLMVLAGFVIMYLALVDWRRID